MGTATMPALRVRTSDTVSEVPRTGDTPSDAQIVGRYRQSLDDRGYKRTTVSTYASQVYRFAEWCAVREIPFAQASTSDATAYVDECYATMKKQSARNRKLALRTFFRWVESEGLRTGDATAGYCRPNPIREPRELPYPDFRFHFLAKGNSERTAKSYAYVVAQLEAWLDGKGKALPAVDLQDLSAYLAESSQRWAPRSLAANVHALRAYFRYLQATGQRDNDPTVTLHVRVPPLKTREPYSEDELARMFGACRTLQERAVISVFVTTGLRASELLSLRIEQIDGERPIGIIGKGGKYRHTKLSPSTLGTVRRYTEGRESGFIFQCRQGLDKAIGQSRLLALVKNVAKRADVPKAYCHRFRHTYAVMFLNAGGDVGALREALGHSTLAMALHYSRWTERERSLECQDRLGHALDERILGV